MNYKKVFIDSLNLAINEDIQLDKSDYFKVEKIKDIGVFEAKRWSELGYKEKLVSGKFAGCRSIYAIHTARGGLFLAKCYHSNPKTVIYEFAGMHSYTDKGETIKADCEQFIREFGGNAYIVRLDLALDYKGNIPPRILKQIESNRPRLKKYKNTTYFKSFKEKKVNQYLDIKAYDKAYKEHLRGVDIYRLEFCFKSVYCKQTALNDFGILQDKALKTIAKISGVNGAKIV